MSILIHQETKVLCQGFTGQQATFHMKDAIEAGTHVVGGVSPGKKGTKHLGLPVWDSVLEALFETKIDASVIYVPAPFAKSAIIEAAKAKIPLIVCITEGIPILDMIQVLAFCKEMGVRLIGPNCPGIITPFECKMGIMPHLIHQKGSIGVVSRSGTLTYEAVKQLGDLGLGQSTCVGIGGDPVPGSTFIDILSLFEKDEKTQAMVMIGEIGGRMEEEAAVYIKKHITKPVVSYIAGLSAPKGRRMGHAGAIASSNSAEEKIETLRSLGVHVALDVTKIGESVLKLF